MRALLPGLGLVALLASCGIDFDEDSDNYSYEFQTDFHGQRTNQDGTIIIVRRNSRSGSARLGDAFFDSHHGLTVVGRDSTTYLPFAGALALHIATGGVEIRAPHLPGPIHVPGDATQSEDGTITIGNGAFVLTPDGGLNGTPLARALPPEMRRTETAAGEQVQLLGDDLRVLATLATRVIQATSGEDPICLRARWNSGRCYQLRDNPFVVVELFE